MNKPYFNFKPNMWTVQRMPFGISPSAKSGGRQVTKVLETPEVATNRTFHGKILRDNSMNSKESYASAMEQMETDEWGDEINWREHAMYEVDNVQAKWKFHAQSPIETLVMQNAKFSPYSSAIQKESSGQYLMEKPLRQSVLNVDNSCGLGFKLEQKQRKMPSHTLVNSDSCTRKIFPQWNYSLEPKSPAKEDGLNFPRVLTVTVEKLNKWPKILTGTNVIFEVYGILDYISDGRFPRSKRIILKSEGMKDRLNCVFYEIDRNLPSIEKGHWQRCMLLIRSNGEYQCLKIRSATPNELKNLDKMVISSSKEKALLLKTLAK